MNKKNFDPFYFLEPLKRLKSDIITKRHLFYLERKNSSPSLYFFEKGSVLKPLLGDNLSIFPNAKLGIYWVITSFGKADKRFIKRNKQRLLLRGNNENSYEILRGRTDIFEKTINYRDSYFLRKVSRRSLLDSLNTLSKMSLEEINDFFDGGRCRIVRDFLYENLREELNLF